MKILSLACYCFPEEAASSYLSQNRNQAMADAGIEMLVSTPTPTRGVSLELRNKYKKIKKEKRFEGMMTVYRFSMFAEGKNPIMRALRYFLIDVYEFFVGAFSKKARSCDVMFIASTPPIQGALAALVKKFNRIPLVYNLQDIFPDSLAGTGLAKKGGLLWKIGRVIENFTYRNADKIIVISEDFKWNIMAKGVPEDKIVVIYNWVDQNAVVDVPRAENILFDRYGLDRNKFYVTYNGNIGLTQNMDMLLEVAKALEANENIQFVLVGNGAYLEQVKQIIKDRNVGNVTLLPFQPYEEISHVFSLGDVSLVISKPGVGANSVPSKTWSIMSASRPVLANFDENELKTIIEENNCGIFTKAGDKVAFTDAILKLYNNRKLCKEMGANGRKFVMNNLTKEVGTQKYVDVIKSFEK
jgi:glycosyltransferase involved in cell wall biosynthesis